MGVVTQLWKTQGYDHSVVENKGNVMLWRYGCTRHSEWVGVITQKNRAVPITHFSLTGAEQRMKRFDFKRGYRYAKYDKIYFEQYKCGRITAETAIRRIAENNQCDPIPVEDFLALAEELGYGNKKRNISESDG